MRLVARAALPLLVLAALAAASCRPRQHAEPAAEAPPAAAAEPGPSIAAETLQPILSANGTWGRLPTEVVIEFARPVQVTLGEDGAPTSATWLEFDPAVRGRIEVKGPSTLTFRPAEPFAPETVYHARLRSVGAGSEVVAPPSEDAWTATFTTPAFRLLDVTLIEFPSGSKEATFELSFAGAVDAKDVGSHVKVLRGASALAATFASVTDAPDVVHARVKDRALRAGETLTVQVAKGIRLVDGHRVAAPEASEAVVLEEEPRSPAITIKGAFPSEGTNGFFIELICDDGSVEEKRWYWDQPTQQGFGEISRTCALDPAGLAEKLSFDPPLAFTTAPGAAGVRVFANLHRGSVTLRLAAGVRTAGGARLRRPFEETLSVPARAPRVNFVTKGRYVPREQWRSLSFQHLNVDAVDVTIRHVRPENLAFWASANDETTTTRESDVLATTRVAVQAAPDDQGTSALDVTSLVPRETRGLVEIQLTAGSVTDTVRLVLTDLQLVVKRAAGPNGAAEGGDVVTWVFDATSLRPVQGVTVDLVRPSGQRVAGSVTDSAGEARLRVPAPALEQAPPFAVLARKGNDVTYLAFDEVEAMVAEEHVGGETPGETPPFRAALWMDRGVFRPGETAHAAGLVRAADYSPAPAGLPVRLRVVDPRGQVLREAALQVDEVGFIALDAPFGEYATTGRHELQLDVAEKRIATHRFHVEEFVPERMRVEVVPQTVEAGVGAPVTVQASARYLFGGVPKGHRAELTCTAETAEFRPKENANFTFGTWQEDASIPKSAALGTVTGELDAEGQLAMSCPTGGAAALAGPQRVVASVAVFESGSGRTTVGQASVPLHPERWYLGLSTNATEAKEGKPLGIDGVVVDWQGRLVTEVPEVTLELVLLQREYGWTWDSRRSESTYRHWLRPTADGTVTVKTSGGRFHADLEPHSWAASVLVRATAGRARTELHVGGADGGDWWDERWDGRPVDRTPRPGRPRWLAITAPALARVGSNVDVTLTAPYRGRMLLTVEAEGVVEREWKDVDAGPVSWSFRLARFQPNVHVTALLMKPPGLEAAESFVADRAYGVVSIPVEPTQAVLPVKLTVPAEVRSGAPLTVMVDVGPLTGSARVTVAAVDEGILSLTKFKTPDPIAQVYTRRALGVKTYETVGWTLLGAPSVASGRGSGDAALALGRVQSVRPVALWSGVRDIPRSGRLEIVLDVPSYRGALRVMAVAATAERMGSAGAEVVVRDPLTLQVTLPRFLLEGDLMQVPVFVTNTTKEPRSVEVTLTATDEDALGLAPPPGIVSMVTVVTPPSRLELAPDEAGTALFVVRVGGSSGAVKLAATARSGDLASTEALVVPVLPTGPRERRVQRVALEQGTTDLTAKLSGWKPLSERTTIRVTANPHGDVFDHLKYLLHYPHGCIEQLTSQTRTLLALQGLVGDIDPELIAKGGVEPLVRSGLDQILATQTPSGAFAYWPGSTQPAWWGTGYAVHLLLDAEASGYHVPRDRVDAALSWMEDRVTNHYEQGRDHGDWYSANAEPWFHFVLAKAGRARTARATALLAAPPGYSDSERAENRFLLQAALYLAGDRRFERELRTADLTPVTNERRDGWSFYSDRRRRGMTLAIRTDLFGVDAEGERLANIVADSLRASPSRWYTTQELTWSLTGLAKHLGASATFAPPVLHVGSGVLAPVPQQPGVTTSERTWSLVRASERGSVTMEVPEKGEGHLYAIVSSEGVRSDGIPALGGNGLSLTRTFVDAAGTPMDLATHPPALGDVVNVVIALTNSGPERVSNLALVGRIPAGWEIENPRLGRQQDLSWIPQDELWSFDHLDVRDDRIEVFGPLDAGETRKVVHSVRAVTAGRFTLPSVEAEAMYDPERWARSQGGTVTVTGPWAPVAQ